MTVTAASRRESRCDFGVSHTTPTRPDPTRPLITTRGAGPSISFRNPTRASRNAWMAALAAVEYEAAPTETRQRLSRGLTHSSDLSREGLAMKATQCCYPPCTKAAAKGRHFCTSHEYRWRKGGEQLERSPRGAELDEVVRRIGWTVTPNGCWEWNGYRSGGYGRLRGEPVTRIMWRITTGEVVPDGRHMCHRCDNPPCVNPDHLFVGTRSDNMRDMWAKGRHPMGRGENHIRAKLTDEQVAEIRARYTGAWGEQTALAREYGISAQHIGKIVKGTRR